MKTSSQFRELLLSIHKNPCGHFRAPCYERLCSFLRGVQLAPDSHFHHGFREKIIANGGPPNLGWDHGLLHALFEYAPDPLRVIITDPQADLYACRELIDRLVEHITDTVGQERGGGDSRTIHAGIREQLVLARQRTGMVVGNPYYEKVCGFVRGLEWVSDIPLTAGLPEWIAVQGGPLGLEWDYGFLHAVFNGDPDPVRTVLLDEAADVRATRELLGWIIERLGCRR